MVYRKRHVDRAARTRGRSLGKTAERARPKITPRAIRVENHVTGENRMLRRLFYWIACMGVTFFAAHGAFGAGEPLKLKIIYSSFTGAYTPLWLAVDDRLGRKYGLGFEAVYAGRARPHQLLLSGEAQFVISTGTGVVSSYAAGAKDLVIIASFMNTTGSSIFSKPQIKTVKELQGKNIASGRPGAVTDILLHYILKRKVGLEPGRDVKIIPVGETPAILPALERGVVDAAMLTTPSRLLARKNGLPRASRFRRSRRAISLRRHLDAEGQREEESGRHSSFSADLDGQHPDFQDQQGA